MFTKRQTTTERLVGEAKDIATEVSQWLQDRLDDAPDPDDLKANISEGTKEAVETARDKVEDIAAWLADLADQISDRVADRVPERLPEPLQDDDGGKGKAIVAFVAAAAAGWYFFEPNKGPERRRKVADKAKSVWARVTRSLSTG